MALCHEWGENASTLKEKGVVMRRIFVLAAILIATLLVAFTAPVVSAGGGDCRPQSMNWAINNWGFLSVDWNSGWYTQEFWGDPVPAQFDLFPGPGELRVSTPTGRNVDARWVRQLNVCPDRSYLLEGDLKAENVQVSPPSSVPGAGVNMSVIDQINGNWFITSNPGLTGTTGWVHVWLPFNTGPNTQLQVAGVRLGMYSGMAVGVARARNIRFQLMN